MSQVSRSGAVWDDASLRQPHAQADKARRVEAMFNAIAPSYERVNAVASLGRDAAWRRRAVQCAAVRPDDVVLDLCCGTGDMIRTFASGPTPPRRILGLDFAAQMLACGRYDGLRPPVQLLRGDALRLPVADASVDVVSCAFGVRNFQRLDAGLREMRRVLGPGGRVVILEFTLPENALLRGAYLFYCNIVLPRVGGWLARDASGAYRYLPKSIATFEPRRSMIARLAEAGFRDVGALSLHFGGVAVYHGHV